MRDSVKVLGESDNRVESETPVESTGVHVKSKRLSPLGKTLMENAPVLQQPNTKEEETTRVIPGTVTSNEEEREVTSEELPIDNDPENNYQSIVCKHCVVRDMVGCDHCGLYIYGYKHRQFKFKATKIS